METSLSQMLLTMVSLWAHTADEKAILKEGVLDSLSVLLENHVTYRITHMTQLLGSVKQ